VAGAQLGQQAAQELQQPLQAGAGNHLALAEELQHRALQLVALVDARA
jgi:hypothetical protein